MVLPGSPSRACLHRYHRTDPGNALPSCRNHGQRRRTSPLSEAVIQPAQRAHGLRVQQRAAQRAGNPTRDCPAAWQPRARRPTNVRPRPLGFCGCTRCSEHVSARWIKERGDGFEGLGGREGPRATQIVPAECLQYRHSVRTRLSVTHWRVGGVLQHGHPCASHNLQGNASSTHASRAQPTAAATLIHRVCGGCRQARTYLAVSTRREHGVSAAIASPFLGENHTSDPTVCRVPLSLKFVA